MTEVTPPPPLRKVLPAFGRPILQARRQHQHPSDIKVVFGIEWRDVRPPKLCLTPKSFVPGRFDWRVVAGVRVLLIDRCQGIEDCDIEAGQYGPLFDLIAELVDAQAYVEVHYLAPSRDRWNTEPAEALAFSCRAFIGGRMQWPRWWSEDRESLQRAASSGYYGDKLSEMEKGQERVSAERK